MSSNSMLLLLKIISLNLDLLPLIKMGYTYAQIAMLIEDAKKSGYIDYAVDNTTVLTRTGNELLSDHYSKEKLFGSGHWIISQDNYRLAPMKSGDIIFPKKL